MSVPEKDDSTHPQTHPTGWITPDQMRTRQSSTRLPWVLVAMLSALSIGLTGILAVQSRELDRLRAQAPVTAAPSGQGSPSTTSQGTPAAEPSRDQKAIELMKSLPRRSSGDAAAMGALDAPVVMIVWSDYRCPFCSVWARETLPKLKPYVDSGSLRIEHRDLVLFGDESMATAKAARAAGNQGKFWEFYTAVHDVAPTSGHPTITEADLVAFAKTAGVADLTKFATDMKSTEINKAVQAETSHARSIGISSTPFFVINTTPLSGAQPTEVFTQTIEGYGAQR